MGPQDKHRKKLDSVAYDAMIDFYNMGRSYSNINYELRLLNYACQTELVSKFLKSRGLLPRPNAGPKTSIYEL